MSRTLVKTATLIGEALDFAVAKAAGLYAPEPWISNPSTDWAQGMALVERENISVIRCNDLYFPSGNENGDHFEQYWKAVLGTTNEYGPTMLIAAMRCFVANKLGDELELRFFSATDQS